MKKLLCFSYSFPNQARWVNTLIGTYKSCLVVFFILISTTSFTQTLPAASSCTSKDLELVGASLAPNPGESVCTCGGTRTLMLTINNKTGSTRTSFALWGTLEIYNSDGSLKSSGPIFACAATIPKSSTTSLASNKQITYVCGESLVIKDLFLAWTSASPNETCAVLEASPSTIAPKCGTLPSIQVLAGVDAGFVVTNATCTSNGSIKVSPFGGIAPYKVKIGNDERIGIPAGGSTTFSLPAGGYDILITDSRPCPATRNRTIGSADAVTANAGADFTKTCTTNASGKQIGEASVSGFTYSWSPSTGLSADNVSNPTANSSSTTTYTVTKTNTSTGCTDTDEVTVTVNNAAVTANAGDDFTKTCTSNASGKQIGEASVSGFTYSWLPSTGLSADNVSNPTANPSSSTTYTVTKTNTSTGCTDTDEVTVTVNNAAVIANAGADFTKTCTTNASGKQIGEASVSGFTYSWSPSTGLSADNVSNPTANPSSTTTYTVTKTNTSTGCFDTDDVTVTVDNAIPDSPSICVVQPSLCGPTTGSVTILSPIGNDYSYSINNGGAWQTGATFSNLAPGSVTGIKVTQNSTGCISGAVSCDASDCTPPQANRSPQPVSTTTTKTVTTAITQSEVAVIGVKAFPNPYNDKVNLVVTSPVAGYGSLEVINMIGQKIKTVYQGKIFAGNQSFEMNVPAQQRSMLIYIFRIGDKQITGKLLQLNQ